MPERIGIRTPRVNEEFWRLIVDENASFEVFDEGLETSVPGIFIDEPEYLTSTGKRFAAIPAQYNSVPPPDPIPPADWRMPATVTVSGTPHANLNTAQLTSAAKLRPSVAVPSSGSIPIIYSVAAHTTNLLLSFFSFKSPGQTMVIETSPDGATWTTIPFAKLAPATFSSSMRRQACIIPPSAVPEQVRLTVTSDGTTDSFYPVLHEIPANSAWDAHIVFGASREEGLMGNTVASGFGPLEAAIVAEHPGRDPIVFSWAMASMAGATIVPSAVNTAIPGHAGKACFAYLGSVLGNDVTSSRPFDESERAQWNTWLGSLNTAFTAAGIKPAFANISYRQYDTGTVVTPTSQTGGSLEYNNEVVHPWIATNNAGWFDAAEGRPRIDEYLHVLRDRGNLVDFTHGTATGYANNRIHKAKTYFRHIYTGTWPTSQVEQVVATYEAIPTQGNQDEANYAMNAMAAGPAKTAYQARIAAVVIPPPSSGWWLTDALVDIDIENNRAFIAGVEHASIAAAITAGAITTINDDYAVNVTGLLPTAYTVVGKGTNSSGAVGTAQYLFSIDDGDDGTPTDAIIYLTRVAVSTVDSIQYAMFTSSASQISNSAATAPSAAVRAAMRVKANDMAISYNGGAAITDTVATLPTLTRLVIGDRTDGTRPWLGTIKRVAIVGAAVANADLPGLLS